jgi:hypothetical protein
MDSQETTQLHSTALLLALKKSLTRFSLKTMESLTALLNLYQTCFKCKYTVFAKQYLIALKIKIIKMQK